MSAALLPLRQANGDPACADLLHNVRISLEVYRDRLLDELAATPMGNVMRPVVLTAWTNVDRQIQAIHALAPQRTRIADANRHG